MATFSFDPSAVSVSIAGQTMVGVAREFVAINRTAAIVRSQVGVDGEVVRWLPRDRRATMQLTLLSRSPSNVTLSQLMGADLLLGAVVFPIIILLHGTPEIHTLPRCWISAAPEAIYSNNIDFRRWTFETDFLLVQFFGGQL